MQRNLRWSALLALGISLGACTDQAPTAPEAELAPAEATFSLGQNSAATQVATVQLIPNPITIKLFEFQQLVFLPRNASGAIVSDRGRAVVWSSSNPAVATVNASGLVEGRSGGTATITVKVDGASATARVTVKAPVTVASIRMTAAASEVLVGGHVQVQAVPMDANGVPTSGYPITWSSSNRAVATVAANGVVTGVSAGTVTISATAGGKTSSVIITVKATSESSQPVAEVKVTVAPGTYSLTVGRNVQMIAMTTDAAGKVLSTTATWTSSNPSVATVDPATGFVTARGAGVATITAESRGVKGTAQVFVANPY